MFAVLAAVAAVSLAAPIPAPVSSAPAPAAAPQGERMVLARRLFTAMGTEASLQASAEAMTQSLFDVLAARRDFQANWRAPAEAAAREAIAAAEPLIMDRWAGLWARDLSEDDLRQAIAFYESPVARKIDGAASGHDAELKAMFSDLIPQIDRDATARFCQKTTACVRPDGV